MESAWLEDLDFYPVLSHEMEMDGVGRDQNAVNTPTSSCTAGQFSFSILI